MNKLPALIENKQLDKIRSKLFEPYLIQDNILVASFFGSWCLIVLDNDFNIISKYWSEKEKILKCFTNFIKKDKLDLNILGAKKQKGILKPFRMDLSLRNSWFDF